MRLEAPALGVALIGIYAAGPRTNVSVNLYFYGDDADARATFSLPKWQAWLRERFSSTRA